MGKVQRRGMEGGGVWGRASLGRHIAQRSRGEPATRCQMGTIKLQIYSTLYEMHDAYWQIPLNVKHPNTAQFSQATPSMVV